LLLTEGPLLLHLGRDAANLCDARPLL
jgi:hypothetical protein